MNINRTYRYRGGSEKIIAMMKKGGIVDTLDTGIIKYKAKKSYGTIMVKGAPGFIDGIYLKVTISKDPKGNTVVNFKSPFRLDLILISGVFLLFFVGTITSGEPLKNTLIAVGIWLFVQGWFYLVYRFQEKWLMESVTDYKGFTLVK